MDPALARLIHQLDQLGEHLKPLARALAQYHRVLIAEGFTRDEALQVVLGIQRIFLERIERSSPPPG